MSRLVLLTMLSGVCLASGRSEEEARFFDERVAPILRKNCLGCHNRELDDGGISFEDRATLFMPRKTGPAVIPGKPNESALIRAVRHNGDIPMPPGKRLTSRDIGTLSRWIERGARWGTAMRVGE